MSRADPIAVMEVGGIEPPDHLRAIPIVSGKMGLVGSARVSVFEEADGEVIIPRLEYNTLLTTDQGAARFDLALDGARAYGPASAGSVALAPQGDHLTSSWTNHHPVQTIRLLEFAPSIFRDYLPELPLQRMETGHLVGSSFVHRPEVSGLIRVLTRELDPATRRGRLYADTALRLLLLEIASNGWSDPVSPTIGASGQNRLDRAIEYIDANLGADLSLVEIAEVAGMSPTKLTRAFRADTGMTPHGYVVDRRLARAVHLLRTSDFPIAVIAFDCGFADQAHLSRLVRNRLGTTPGSLRKG